MPATAAGRLRPEVSAGRLERRASLRELLANGMPDLEKATSKYALDEYYGKALSLVISGRARKAFSRGDRRTRDDQPPGQRDPFFEVIGRPWSGPPGRPSL